jgi:hypothetical protein
MHVCEAEGGPTSLLHYEDGGEIKKKGYLLQNEQVLGLQKEYLHCGTFSMVAMLPEWFIL